MNYTSAVMLINPNIRAVKVSYTAEDAKKKITYTFKTLDTTIVVGDTVIVPTTTRHGFTGVIVEEVDVEVDFDSNIQLKWVIGKADFAPYNSILQEEAKWVEAIKASEKRKKREELKNSMLAMYKDDIDGLAITNMATPPLLENQVVGNTAA